MSHQILVGEFLLTALFEDSSRTGRSAPMKRFLFIYSDSCDFDCYTYESYSDVLHHEEATFPKGTTDWEIVDSARSYERYNERRNVGCAGESRFTRRLVRIIELARDVSFDPSLPADISEPANSA